MGKKNEKFQMEKLKIITGTLIVVLLIQFKPFGVFGGTRAVPIIIKFALYICCWDWFEVNKEEYTIP